MSDLWALATDYRRYRYRHRYRYSCTAYWLVPSLTTESPSAIWLLPSLWLPRSTLNRPLCEMLLQAGPGSEAYEVGNASMESDAALDAIRVDDHDHELGREAVDIYEHKLGALPGKGDELSAGVDGSFSLACGLLLVLLVLAILSYDRLRARRTQHDLCRPQPAESCGRDTTIAICCPGGGVFFWWQIGAMKRLLEMYELPSDARLAGMSAGALAVVLGQCGVDPARAHELAFGLARRAGVFRNPLGLFGKWGRLVDMWLQSLLPDDAAARCDGRCHVLVTRLARFPEPEAIQHYKSRESVVDALMASTHIPYFMDGRLASSRLDVPAADGGLLVWLGLRTTLSLLLGDPVGDASHESNPHVVVLSHHKDAPFMEACRRNWWLPVRTKGTELFAAYGAEWVEREARRGTAGELAALEPFRRSRSGLARLTSENQECAASPSGGAVLETARESRRATLRPRRSPRRARSS